MVHFKALREAWERFAADDQAWVAIVTGVGEAFFAGADLKTYVPEITKFQKEIAEKGLTEIDGFRLDDGTRSVLRNWPLYKPVIAAVNGFCTAGGMEMLGGCDIRVACPEAKFAVMEPKRGLFAGGGTTVRLPRQIPWAQAMEFLLSRGPDPGRARLRDGAPQHDRSPFPAARQSPRVRSADDRQRAARGAGDQAKRPQWPLRRRGRDHASPRGRARLAAPRSNRSTPPIRRPRTRRSRPA